MADGDDIRTMFDSRYLGAWDFAGSDITVTIARIEGAVIEGEMGRQDRAPIIHFKGWSKPMVLNKTNMRTLVSMYSTHKASELVGKRVTVYATQCRGAKGGMVDCIRFRNVIPERPGVPQSVVGERPVDQAMRARQVEGSGGTK